jgi:ketosteroid isomerase-like protein
MPSEKPVVIRAIFAAYLANDSKAVENYLTDDFRFTSPYDDAIDKATYFERCWRRSDWIERHELERIVVEGNEAFVTYRCSATDGKSFAIPSSSASKATRSGASTSISAQVTSTASLPNCRNKKSAD